MKSDTDVHANGTNMDFPRKFFSSVEFFIAKHEMKRFVKNVALF